MSATPSNARHRDGFFAAFDKQGRFTGLHFPIDFDEGDWPIAELLYDLLAGVSRQLKTQSSDTPTPHE